MGWWDSAWKTLAEDWVYGWLGPQQVRSSFPTGAVEANASYLNIFLKSARVVDVRKGLTTFYGVVHSFMKLPHRSLGTAEFNVVTTPDDLKNVDARVDRVVQVNQRLLGPTPYVGGDLEIEVGLFSVPSSDLAAPYLSLLKSLSNAAGVAFMTSALPFAGPILEGVKLLTGGQGTTLEIGLSMTEPAPRQGYCVVMRAPKNAVPVSNLKLDPSDFRLLDSKGQPIAQYPYLVLEVQSSSKRDDWFQIPDLAKAYSRVQALYREGNDKDTEAALQMFRRVAKTCNDLLMEDADLLANKVASMYQIVTAAQTGRGVINVPGPAVAVELPDLQKANLYS